MLDIVKAIRDGAEIDVCIPEGLPSQKLWESILDLGHHSAKIEKYDRALKYALGMAMTMAARRPEFLGEVGFEKFGDLEDALIKRTGLSRSTLWVWKPIAEGRPDLTREHLSKIPQQSLSLLVRHVPESKQPAMLEAAAEMTYSKFKTLAEAQGLVGAAEVDGASIIVSGARAQIAELRRYLEHPEVIEYVGTPDKCEIFLALIGEAQSSSVGWPKI